MKRAKYKEKPLSFMEFSEKYATEDACRQKVFEARWPNGDTLRRVCEKASFSVAF